MLLCLPCSWRAGASSLEGSQIPGSDSRPMHGWRGHPDAAQQQRKYCVAEMRCRGATEALHKHGRGTAGALGMPYYIGRSHCHTTSRKLSHIAPLLLCTKGLWAWPRGQDSTVQYSCSAVPCSFVGVLPGSYVHACLRTSIHRCCDAQIPLPSSPTSCHFISIRPWLPPRSSTWPLCSTPPPSARQLSLLLCWQLPLRCEWRLVCCR